MGRVPKVSREVVPEVQTLRIAHKYVVFIVFPGTKVNPAVIDAA